MKITMAIFTFARRAARDDLTFQIAARMRYDDYVALASASGRRNITDLDGHPLVINLDDCSAIHCGLVAEDTDARWSA